MKYIEAEKKIKELSGKYDINMIDGDFNVVYNDNGNKQGSYVTGYREYDLHVGDIDTFSKLPFSNKLYMIMAELAATPLEERAEERKHYVKVLNNDFGYLNIENSTSEMVVSGMPESHGYKTKFTDKEIEQLKQRDDVPLDWNKVTFEDVEDE